MSTGEPLDPLSFAWKQGYQQAKDEDSMEQKFCPHCNPCRRASEITKAEAERDALRALLLETENKRTDIPGFVRWYSLWCARVDAALAQDSER